MSLLSLVLTLRPRQAAELPSALGRAAHAALLAAIGRVNPALAQRLHDEAGPRPFTCSSLLGIRQAGAVTPDLTYTLRYTALTAELAEVLPGLFPPGEAEVELDRVAFAVEAAASEAGEHPWAGHSRYEDLAARWLLAQERPEAQISLHLASPTAFKVGGKVQPFPLPELVFGSLLEKWNAYAPLAFPEETRRFAAECLGVSRFELGTHAAPFKGEGVVKFGAVGTVTYAALNRDRYWLSLIHVLADFAQFAGAGTGTTMGMGQCRRV
ncbi:MAG: CRISPR-associated protein Cas6 [Chloroflexota bacterium]